MGKGLHISNILTQYLTPIILFLIIVKGPEPETIIELGGITAINYTLFNTVSGSGLFRRP